MLQKRTVILTYGACLLTFVALDAAWISLVAIHQFRDSLGDMLRSAPRIVPSVAFYLIYIAGLLVLAVLPALSVRSWSTAAGLGAMLGLAAYATFDLTNLAIIDRWAVSLALTDMAWGTALSAVVATVGYAIGSRHL